MKDKDLICVTDAGHKIHEFKLDNDVMTELDEAFERLETALKIVMKHCNKSYTGKFSEILFDMKQTVSEASREFESYLTRAADMSSCHRLTIEQEIEDRESSLANDSYDYHRAMGRPY